MKKIIILAIATLSTGIVLSGNLKKNDVVVKPVTLDIQKGAISQKNVSTPENDAIATGD